MCGYCSTGRDLAARRLIDHFGAMDASSQLSDNKNTLVNVAIGLNAVLAVVEDAHAKVLCVQGSDDSISLPYGPFDPAEHRTFEIGLRDWVEQQTKITLGYIEQLYTFGDMGREAPAAALANQTANDRVVSIGYLALAPEPATINVSDAQWRDWYEFFPLEDWRRGEPGPLSEIVLPALDQWANAAIDEPVRASRIGRIRLAFGHDSEGWEEERALDRFELMYEAGLVAEAWRDRRETPDEAAQHSINVTGRSMSSDHRRILATAIDRLRGKLKYRPVIFRLMPKRFTLLALQQTAEAIVGFAFHKQNFRRSVETGGFVARTNETTKAASGRPAAMFTISETVQKGRAASGLAIPRIRATPAWFENRKRL